MDASTAAAWLVLGVLLGVLALGAVAAGVAARRRRTEQGTAPPVDGTPRVDDLADFLEHPPGTRTAAPGPDGWATLAPPPPPRVALPARQPATRRDALLLAALGVAALAAVGVTVAVAARPGGEPSARVTETQREPVPAPGTDDVVADLVFSGLVLEPRAVGVTAAYPEARVTVDGDAARLELRLPTYNCLTQDAPPDPVAAGCAATLVEHGALEPGEVRSARDGDRWVLQGRLATWTRPAGSPPEPTGRVYDLELTLLPGGEAAADGWRSAAGRLRLGTGTATADEGSSRLRTAG